MVCITNGPYVGASARGPARPVRILRLPLPVFAAAARPPAAACCHSLPKRQTAAAAPVVQSEFRMSPGGSKTEVPLKGPLADTNKLVLATEVSQVHHASAVVAG